MIPYKYTTCEYYHATHNVLSFLPLELAELCLKMAGNPEITLIYNLKTQEVVDHTAIQCKDVIHVSSMYRDCRDPKHTHIVHLDPDLHQSQINRLRHMEKFLKKQVTKKFDVTHSGYDPFLEYKTTKQIEVIGNYLKIPSMKTIPRDPYYVLKLYCGHSTCPMKHKRVQSTCDIRINLRRIETRYYSWDIYSEVLFE